MVNQAYITQVLLQLHLIIYKDGILRDYFLELCLEINFMVILLSGNYFDALKSFYKINSLSGVV
jgi:hypothetical protein